MKKSMLVAASICAMLAAISVGGCGSNNTSGSGNNQPKQEQKASEAQEYYNKFVSIQMGISYDEAKTIMGSDGQQTQSSDTGNLKSASYKWDGPKGINISLHFQNGVLKSKQIMGTTSKAPKGKEVTMDKFNQIQTGMSYDDVKGILGFDGCLSSETKLFNSDQKIFHWHNPKGGFLQVSFKDGAVDSKMQSNLK